MKRLCIILTIFLLPLCAAAAADLRIDQQDIRFSKPSLVAGDIVRIYAKIYNIGDEDVSGYVSFYQGSILIDQSLVISVLANGNPEEVYVDFLVPESSFNIMAKIQGTDPADTNTDNDFALTSVFEPMVDDDRDTLANDFDNCPALANSDQTDTDLDGQGDACDEDDDNDGLSDEVEAELGTDAAQADSDADGVDDAHDAYPTDAKRTVVEPVSTPRTETFLKIVEEVARTIKATDAESTGEETSRTLGADEQDKSPFADAQVSVYPNAVLTYTRDAWNSFTFSVQTNAPNQAFFIWNFGDGVTSSKQTASHVYASSGAFDVTLAMTDENGIVSTQTTEVFVPFFHLKNSAVLASILLMLMLIAIGVAFVARRA